MLRIPWRHVAMALLLTSLACGARDRAGDTAPPAEEQEQTAADAAEPATPPAPPSKLEALRADVGKYPRDTGLFDREPLHGRLVALLGDRYATFLADMGTQGPLSAEGPVLYVLGNKPHAGGDDQAVLLIDLSQDLVHVYLLEEQQMAELKERDADIEWPLEVQTTIATWQDLGRGE